MQLWRSWYSLVDGRGQSRGSKSDRTFSVPNSGEYTFHCSLPKWHASDVASLYMSVGGTLPWCEWTCPPHQTSQLLRGSLCFIATENCPDHSSLPLFLACQPRKCSWNRWVVTCGLWIRLLPFVSQVYHFSISRSSMFLIYKMEMIIGLNSCENQVRKCAVLLVSCLTLINYWGTE